MKKTSGLLLALLASSLVLTDAQPAMANSTVIDGPGFKVEKKNGWFGRESTVYQDALGNAVERKTGFFGKKSSRTKLFGSEAVKKGDNVSVIGPDGKPLVTTKRTLFGGKQTHVDGNGIFQSLKDLMQGKTTP